MICWESDYVYNVWFSSSHGLASGGVAHVVYDPRWNGVVDRLLSWVVVFIIVRNLVCVCASFEWVCYPV